MPTRLSCTLALCLLLTTRVRAEEGRPQPYLDKGAIDEESILPPPPAADSPVHAWEQRVYEATRALQGTPRWTLATSDVDRNPASVLGDFACALGRVPDPAALPQMVHLLGRLNADVEQATARIKAHYRRPRPLVGNDAPLCQARDTRLAESFSYPSGHATQGWATALVLAEIAPEAASAILARGRTYGDSRVVCGAHWPSDVAAGREAAAALVAVLHADPAFRADLDAARHAWEEARSAGAPRAPEAGACALESEAATTRLDTLP